MTDEHVRAKHPVLSLLGGALGGGFAGGFLWFFLDNIVRINGQGWLQRLPWPVPGLALFVAAGAVLGGVTGLVRGLRERARVAPMGEAAATMGLAYAPTSTKDRLGLSGSAIFPHW